MNTKKCRRNGLTLPIFLDPYLGYSGVVIERRYRCKKQRNSRTIKTKGFEGAFPFNRFAYSVTLSAPYS